MINEAARAAAIQFGIRCGYDVHAPGWDSSRIHHVISLLQHGTERLKDMVVAHEVGLEAGDLFARRKTPEEQNTATPSEIKKYHTSTRSPKSKLHRKRKEDSYRQQRNEAAIAAALRTAAKPKVTAEEFELPSPELLDQQYPGREPGVTYAHVHREEHGPIWHNVAQRRQLNLVRRLKELAAQLEKTVEELRKADMSILDPVQLASVRKRFAITVKKVGVIDLKMEIVEEGENENVSRVS